MVTHIARGMELERGWRKERGYPPERGEIVERGDKALRPELTREISDSNTAEEVIQMANILAMAGKHVGSPIVVFPDNIAGGSFIPGIVIRFIENILVQISVGTVVIQDGAWKPVEPFVAGDQVFVPINAIDTFV